MAGVLQNESVLGRDVRISRHKKGDLTMAEREPLRQTLGISAVKSYVATIVDLWSFQGSDGMHPVRDFASQKDRSS